MFKSKRQNNRSSKSGERVDFKFSNFQALQVPKGWDRLFLSMISVETGKTIAKLGKGLVRNGNCQWSETLLESVWTSEDNSSKQLEDSLFKLVISMGSSRAGILGEAIINMSSYMSSGLSSPVSLPLRKCNHGTVLQVKIHCLTPVPNRRNETPNCSTFRAKDQAVDYHDIDHKPNTSGDSFANGAKFSSSQDLDLTSCQRNYDGKESNYAESVSDNISTRSVGSTKRNPFNLNQKLDSNGYGPQRRHVGVSSKGSSADDQYPVDDRSLSSQSSCNSGEMLSRMDLQSSESGAASLSNAGSKNLLEAAEITIEELRAEAKMWERNASKLMLDLDMLRNEFLDQSKKQAGLVMDLSAAYAEHDGLKKEIEQLKSTLEESTVKQRAIEDSTFQSESLTHIQKELESEIKYQQETNANLTLQLQKSQESNIELVSVLQELEETIEQQKVEIENLAELKSNFTNVESPFEQSLEENKDLLAQLQQLQELEKTLQTSVQFLEKALEDKIIELEDERTLNRQSLLDVERDYKYKLLVKDDKIALLEAKFLKSVRAKQSEDMVQNNEGDVDLIQEIESLRQKVLELERDCNELTEENLELLLKLKESKNIEECAAFSSTSSELPTKSPSAQSEVSDSEPQMYNVELKQYMNKEEEWATLKISPFFLELLKQIEMSFHHLMKPLSDTSTDVTEKCKDLLDDLVNLTKKKTPNSKLLTESIVRYLFDLNNLLEEKTANCEHILKSSQLEIKKRNDTIAEAEKSLRDHIMKLEEHEHSKAELEADYEDLLKELSQKRSEIDELGTNLLRKELEANSLIQRHRELEIQIADLELKKDQLEENSKIVHRESNITSKCLDDLQNDLAVLRSSLDFHVSAKKDLEKKSAELEREKCRLEEKLVELDQENLQLQERISVLEMQMRHCKDVSESCQLELHNSKSAVMILQSQVRNMETEMENHEVNLKQNLQHMHDQLLEAQREGEYLKTENEELQASALRLSEECKILQKLNKELKQKELELHEQCAQMEAQLEASEKSFSDCSEKVEALGRNLTSMLEAFAWKEKNLSSELDVLLQENRKEKEKLIRQETLSNQMHGEMSSELKNLQKEVECLTKQISAANEEKEKVESEALSKISSLHSDKAKLESTLEEVHSILESSESELNTIRVESQLRVQTFMAELDASKQSHAILMADHEKLLRQLASYRTSEEKLKTAVNDLELKLTVSDYENQQLREDNVNKKFSFQRIADLQDEVSALKRKTDECRFEKEKQEASLQTISADYESLKAEKIACVEKIMKLREAMAEYESCKQKRIILEEKLLQMECALLAKETLCAHQKDLENELREVKSANDQYQQKIYQLEEEKAEYSNKAQALEADLKLMRETDNCGRKGYKEHHLKDESPCAVEVTCLPKRNEPAEALEADKIQKIELQSFSSEEEEQSQTANDSPVVAKERYQRTKSSLETELRDLRERYFNMSLKYAEVEAQREDLVMRLKAAKSGKRWF